MNTATRKSFAGMAYTDPTPHTIPGRYVRPVHMFDVPTTFREHAHEMLDSLPGVDWWTIGEFRYEGGMCMELAVARKIIRDGNMIVEYGIEG